MGATATTESQPRIGRPLLLPGRRCKCRRTGGEWKVGGLSGTQLG
jgi:hypothetical protein